MRNRAIALLCMIMCVGLLLAGCTSISGGGIARGARPDPPMEGVYTTTGGWGEVRLWKTEAGFQGSYTDTWQSETGDLYLWIEDGVWVGSWEEPVIDRGGDLYRITISDDGTTVTGLANVTRMGGHSQFKDVEFSWVKQ